MLGWSHEHDGPGGVRGRGPRPRRRARSRRRSRAGRASSRRAEARAGPPVGGPSPRHRRHRASRPPADRPCWPTSRWAATAPQLVAAFTPEPFALALGISPSAGAQLIADALDLRHRLPILWKRVRRLEVPAWQARRVARQTHRLPLAGARWVDEQLAERSSCGLRDRRPPRRPRHRHLRPRRPREDSRTTRQADWDVILDPPGPNRLRRHLTPGSPRRHPDLEDVLRPCLRGRPPAVPGRRHRSARGPRRSRPSASSPASPRRPAHAKVKVYARVEAARPRGRRDGGSALAAGEIEKLGAATLTKIRDWVGHHQVVIQPVLNMQRARRRRLARPTRLDARPRRSSATATASSPAAPSTPGPATSTTPSPTNPTAHPAKPDPTTLPALCRRHHRAKTPESGGTPARPTATTSGTGRTASSCSPRPEVRRCRLGARAGASFCSNGRCMTVTWA